MKSYKKNIAFIQYELTCLNSPPHLGSALFINDLKKEGFKCDAYIINCNNLSEAIQIITKKDYEVICIDSIFPKKWAFPSSSNNLLKERGTTDEIA